MQLQRTGGVDVSRNASESEYEMKSTPCSVDQTLRPAIRRPRTLLSLSLGAVLVASLSSAGPALAGGGKDIDRDGLNAKQERKAGTNPRLADTDRDLLKDGAEVKKFRTNPRKADTDGDGLKDGREVKDGLSPRSSDTDADGISDRYERKGVISAIDGETVSIVSKRGAQISFTVDADTFLEGVDRDGDGSLSLADFQAGDRVEANLSADGTRALTLELKADDDLDERKGSITDIVGDSVTIEDRNGASITFAVDLNTYFRAPDRNASGTVTLADFEVGDRVEVHLNSDGSLALSMELKFDRNEYGDDDGYGDDDHNEAKGYITSIDLVTGEVVLERRGVSVTVIVDADTFFRGPDRDSSGSVDLADFQIGDEVEARLAADGFTALGFKGEDDEDDEHSDGDRKFEAKGTISALTENTVTVMRFDGSEVTFTAVVGTRFEVPDRDLSGVRNLADFQIGDRVEAKFDAADNTLYKLGFEGGEHDDDDEGDDD